MPSFTQTKSNKLWSVRFRIVENHALVNKRLSGFPTKKDANKAYVDYVASYVPETIQSDFTFQELYNHYKKWASSNMKESSYITGLNKIENHILPYFAKKKVHKISKADVLSWHTQIDTLNFKYTYKSSLHQKLVTLLNFAEKFYDITNNVARQVGNFKNLERPNEMLFWDLSEFKKFYASLTTDFDRLLYAFLYLTGVRKGELQALQWNHYDKDKSTISIDSTLTSKTNGSPYALTAPKSYASIRKILLPSNICNMLNSIRPENATAEHFIFGQEDKPLAAETLRRNFSKLCETAHVKRIRIHDFRHSHASYLIAQGCDIVTIAKRLGHSNIEETLNTYAHMLPDKQTEIVNKLNNIL